MGPLFKNRGKSGKCDWDCNVGMFLSQPVLYGISPEMVVNLELEWTFSRSPTPQFKCHRKLPRLPYMLYSAYDIVLSLWPVTHNEGSQNWAINRKPPHLSSSPLPPNSPSHEHHLTFSVCLWKLWYVLIGQGSEWASSLPGSTPWGPTVCENLLQKK